MGAGEWGRLGQRHRVGEGGGGRCLYNHLYHHLGPVYSGSVRSIVYSYLYGGCARVGRVEMSPFQTEEDGWGDRSRTKSVQAQQAAPGRKIYKYKLKELGL